MKIAFLVCNEVYAPRLMTVLGDIGIDYYTRWDKATGKGHATEPHLGTRSFPGYNAVLMIAFRDEAALEGLVSEVTGTNAKIVREDDRIRLFQVPLERII
jgi:hypothetical protein